MVNKKDLIAKTAGAIGVTQKDVAVVVDAFLEAVANAVAEKEDVTLGDLGKFKTVATSPTEARTMVSGLTGKEVSIPAKPAGVKATFKISKKLRDSVQ